jgi:voltage-gated potassium channel
VTRLRRWNRWVRPLVVVAAILPLSTIIAGDDPSGVPEAPIAIACWFVFVADFVAQFRLHDAYLAAWRGRVYLGIVIVTTPIYLVVPALDETDLLSLARLGWVAILIGAAGHGMRGVGRLARRLGVAGLYALAAVLVGAAVVFKVESPEDGFETFGDSLWWSIVTITSVGYGDLAPVTARGRIVGVGLMIAGLAFLGVAAGSLAAFFRVEDADRAGDKSRDDARHDELLAEIRRLSAEVARLGRTSDPPSDDVSD